MNNYERYEIVQLYKGAADKNKQIKILAELNCCSEAEIFNILAEEGAISGVSKKMHKGASLKESAGKKSKRVSERGKWTEERLSELKNLVEQGIKRAEIAERMGESPQAISDAVRKYIKKSSAKGKEEKGTSPQSLRDSSLYTREPESEADENTQAEPLKSSDPERECIGLINSIEDMRSDAIMARDICRIIGMFSMSDVEYYESTVQTLVFSIGNLLDDIISRGSEKVER